jgi:hypothetical protein
MSSNVRCRARVQVRQFGDRPGDDRHGCRIRTGSSVDCVVRSRRNARPLNLNVRRSVAACRDSTWSSKFRCSTRSSATSPGPFLEKIRDSSVRIHHPGDKRTQCVRGLLRRSRFDAWTRCRGDSKRTNISWKNRGSRHAGIELSQARNRKSGGWTLFVQGVKLAR